MKMRRLLQRVAIAAAVLLAGCATAPSSDARDPFEPFNRTIEEFNHGVDQAVLKPAAKGYEKAVPGVVRQGVSNFFANLGDVWSAANTAMQGSLSGTAQNLMRFAVNTVFGLGGVIDIASDAGMERHKTDFGTTLARWGVGSGPYIVLPLLGPSSLRDTVALPVDLLGDPLRPVSPALDRNLLVGTRVVDGRARALLLDPVLDSAFDRYTFMRDAYLQHRSSLAGSAEERDVLGALDNDPAAPGDPALQ